MAQKDMIIVGGGPAGYAGAVRASQCGAKVMLLERAELGGTCLHRGCIPTKSFLQSAEVLEMARKSTRFGVTTGDATLDFARMVACKDQVVRTLLSGLRKLMAKNAVEVVEGSGRLVSGSEVRVEAGGRAISYTSNRIILATGSSRAIPPIPGVDGAGVITTDELWSLDVRPDSIAVIGAGPSGVEIANIFALLGSRVVLVEMLPRIIPAEDPEMADVLERCLRRAGVHVHTGTVVQTIEDGGHGSKRLTLADDRGMTAVDVGMVVISTGSRPNTQGLGLGHAGVEMEGDAIRADDGMATSAPGIWAAGDVVGGIMLAHVASREAEVAAGNALGRNETMDYRAVPSCIYTMPEIASAGLSEAEATAKGYDVRVGRFSMAANSRALILGERNGLVKIVADAESDEVLGIHICGARATELVAEAAVCIAQRITAGDLAAMVHAHPTLHEAIRDAAMGMMRPGK